MKVTEPVLVRPILPGDLAELAALHEVVFVGQLGASVGQRYIRRFVGWFVNYSPAITLVAEMEGALVGYAFGAPVGYSGQLNRDLFWINLVALLTHPRAWTHPKITMHVRFRLKSLLGRGGRRETSSKECSEAPRQFSLVGIGVAPQCRQMGIATKLLSEFQYCAKRQGFELLTLSVYASNLAARRFYETQGWRQVGPAGDVVRYVCPL